MTAQVQGTVPLLLSESSLLEAHSLSDVGCSTTLHSNSLTRSQFNVTFLGEMP